MQASSARPNEVDGTLEQWNNVGGAVRARRDALGFTLDDVADRSGVSRSVLTNLEYAKQTRFRRRGLIGICRALGWTDDSIEGRLLQGDAPQLVPGATPTTAPDPRSRVTSMSPTEDRIRRVENAIDSMRSEIQELRELVESALR